MVALVLSALGLAASPHSFEGAYAEAAHHGGMAGHAGGHDHDHDHDQDEKPDQTAADESGPAAKAPGHKHAHNAADHSHVTPGIPPTPASFAFEVSRTWQAMPEPFADLKTYFSLDRPPKSPFSV